MWGRRWKDVAISSRSRDISTSGLPTAILKNRLPVTSGGVRNSAIEMLDHENVGVAVGISLLS